MKPIILSTCLGVWLGAAVAALGADASAPGTNGTPDIKAASDTNAAPDQGDPTDQTPQPPAAPDDASAPASPAPATAAPAAPTNTAPPPVAPAASVTFTPPAPGSNVIATASPPPAAKTVMLPSGEKGLILNFRGAPLEDVLNYMSDAAGFIIHPKTDVRGKVDVWSAQPLSKTDAVKLLKDILTDNGYTIIQDGRELTIVRSDDAKTRNIPVIMNPDPNSVPKNADIVTQIDPIRTLNAVQLVKTLETLKPSSMTMTADESANSLVMTDTQENIHHMMEIISSLDSVTSGSSSIRVFPLRFADSKSLASLIKDLYPNPDAQQGGRGGLGGGFGRLFSRGGGGGFPFGGSSGGDNSGDNSGNGHTPTAKVNAVSDDHSNSLIVSAPDSLINDIAELVKEVDVEVEDTTAIRVFPLTNSDPGELADLLTSLFPDDTGASSDASRSTNPFGFRFGGFGGFSGQQNSAAAGQSDRMKRLARVVAVAEHRTQSLVVTASTNMMPQIAEMIAQIDSRRDRVMSPHLIRLTNSDPVDVIQNLQDLFTSTSTSGRSGSSSSSATQNNPLLNRQTTQLQQQNSSSTSSFSSFGSGGGSPRN